MTYAIETLENELESEKIVVAKVTGNFKNSIQENIEELELAIHNLKMLTPKQ